MLKLVILDLDQTILDTLHRFHEVFNEVLDESGGEPLSWEKFVKYYSEDRLDEFIPSGVDKEEFWREFATRYAAREHPEDAPIKGAREALEELRSMGLKIVVTTGRRATPEQIWDELRKYGFVDLVDAVYTLGQLESNSGGLWHRHELIERVLRDFRLSPREAIFVGDYWVDVESARMAGVLSVGVLTGLEPPERLRAKGADYIIEGIWELPDLLRRLTTCWS